MARTLNLPAQNVTFNIPETEEVFRAKNDPEAIYRIRPDNRIERLTRDKTRGQIDVASLPEYNLTDVGTALSRIFNIRPEDLQFESSDVQSFVPKPTRETKEAFTLSPGVINPQSAVVTSNLRGTLQEETPLPTGVERTGETGPGGLPIFGESPTRPLEAPTRPVTSPKGLPPLIAPLGSKERTRQLTERTNQLLQQASKRTGRPAPTFTTDTAAPTNISDTAAPTAPVTPTAPIAPISPEGGLQPESQEPEPSLHNEIMGTLKELGIDPPSLKQSPITSAADIYKQFAEMNNLFGTKKDLEDLVNKKTQEIANINENPWISEGLRVKKINNIENKYQARIDNLQSIFNRVDEDARFLTGKYLEQVHQTREDTQRVLFKAVDLAERELSGRRAERQEREKIREFETREKRLGREFREREKRLGKAERDRFTGKQIERGAAIAGIPIRDFENLDEDSQNLFINSPTTIKDRKKLIDTYKKEGRDPTEIERLISESTLPDVAKDVIVRYLWSVFPRPKTKKSIFRKVIGK